MVFTEKLITVEYSEPSSLFVLLKYTSWISAIHGGVTCSFVLRRLSLHSFTQTSHLLQAFRFPSSDWHYRGTQNDRCADQRCLMGPSCLIPKSNRVLTIPDQIRLTGVVALLLIHNCRLHQPLTVCNSTWQTISHSFVGVCPLVGAFPFPPHHCLRWLAVC